MPRTLVALVVVATLAGCGSESSRDAGDPLAARQEYISEADALCAEVQGEAAELMRRAQEIAAQRAALGEDEARDRASDLWSDQIDLIDRYRERFADLDPPPGDEPRHDELVASLDEGLETARAIKESLDDEAGTADLLRSYAATVASGNALARAYGFQVCGR